MMFFILTHPCCAADHSLRPILKLDCPSFQSSRLLPQMVFRPLFGSISQKILSFLRLSMHGLSKLAHRQHTGLQDGFIYSVNLISPLIQQLPCVRSAFNISSIKLLLAFIVPRLWTMCFHDFVVLPCMHICPTVILRITFS